MSEINFRPSENTFSNSVHNVHKTRSTVGPRHQNTSPNNQLNRRDAMRTQQSLTSNYEKALNSPTQTEAERKQLAKQKMEELKKKVIEVLSSAANSISSIEQAKRVRKILDILAKGAHLNEIINGIQDLKEVFPDISEKIFNLMETYSEVKEYLEDIKDIADAFKELANHSERIKGIMNSKVSNILSKVGGKILQKLGPVVKIAGAIGKAVEAILTVKEAIDIITSDKSIEEKGVDFADLIIRKVLDFGGTIALGILGNFIAPGIGGAIGTIVGGIIGLVGGWDWIADRAKDIGLTKAFADYIITPILRLFDKPAVQAAATG